MRRVVADTGPLFHLYEAAAIHLLPALGEIFLPPLVAAELGSLAPDLKREWAKPQKLCLASQQRAMEWQRAGLLHGGEAEALALAIELKPDWFITDDAAARLMAETLNVEVHGSIGIVLWAAANKFATEAEAQTILAGLEKSSLWMSPKVRTQARIALSKIFSNQ